MAAPTFALFAGIRTRHPARCMPLLVERRGEGQELLGGGVGVGDWVEEGLVMIYTPCCC